MLIPYFKYKCPGCGVETTAHPCSCGVTVDLFEALCIHGFAYDMACDDCVRSGFRVEGVNDGTEEERAACTGTVECDHCRAVFEDTELPSPPTNEPYLPPDLIEDQLADEGSLDGPGFRCGRMKDKTMSEEDWKAIHNEHKGFLRQEYKKEYNEIQPPSYRLYKLICPGCGASLQCMEELEGVD